MAGPGDGRDYGGSNRSHGGGGRDYGGHREYSRGHRGYDSDRGDGSNWSYEGDRRSGDRSFDRVGVGELREDVREDVRQEIREAINELVVPVARGKQKKTDPITSAEESDASSSETEELNLQTRRLCISEKCKHGPEAAIEGSPPMELPPKRTAVRATHATGGPGRLTRSRARTQKAATPKKTPPLIRKKTPATIGIVGKLHFEKQVLNDLKNLDALVLQNICKDEGIPYNGKFEVILAIAAHRTHVAYNSDNDEEVLAPPVVSMEAVTEKEREEEEG
ncbi:hypothetical protein CBR_g34171 [Chara braunii]|uniref:Uncharacterized protein n=1 Tax=Chara braunii TaxID=69332 RepID=A0A388LIA7_CHABU|nr:hypothetical protein CBR_g34171 [Chara braunii]|eukprot:GBG81991.1 hypothetical protein CBR_g34171 [Chara braunii]